MTDLSAKNILITGSTGGIGKETARALARLGARVLLVGRDPDRAERAAAELARDTGNPRIEALTADVTRQRDLRALAGQAGRGPLDVLINNAGVTRSRRELTEDGVEATFAGNVVAPYLLTRLLRPALEAAPNARVVNITGGVPKGRLDLGNLQGERSFVGLSVYNQCKLAQMAMSHTFAEHLAGSGVSLNVAYPGHAYTGMNRGLEIGTYPPAARPIVPLLKLVMPVLYGNRAVVRATRSSVHLAASSEVDGVHGVYFTSRARPAPWPEAVRDEHNRAHVWRLCERLTGPA